MTNVKNISTSRNIFANNVDLWRKVCYTFLVLYFKYLRCAMAASYQKLFKLMIDREIKSKDLASMAGISPTTLAKMKKEYGLGVLSLTDNHAVKSVFDG